VSVYKLWNCKRSVIMPARTLVVMASRDSKEINQSPHVIIVGAGYALDCFFFRVISLNCFLSPWANRLAGISAAIQLKCQLGYENFTVSFRFHVTECDLSSIDIRKSKRRRRDLESEFYGFFFSCTRVSI